MTGVLKRGEDRWEKIGKERTGEKEEKEKEKRKEKKEGRDHGSFLLRYNVQAAPSNYATKETSCTRAIWEHG